MIAMLLGIVKVSQPIRTSVKEHNNTNAFRWICIIFYNYGDRVACYLYGFVQIYYCNLYCFCIGTQIIRPGRQGFRWSVPEERVVSRRPVLLYKTIFIIIIILNHSLVLQKTYIHTDDDTKGHGRDDDEDEGSIPATIE